MSFARMLNESPPRARKKVPRSVMKRMIESGRFKVIVGGTEITDFKALYDSWLESGSPGAVQVATRSEKEFAPPKRKKHFRFRPADHRGPGTVRQRLFTVQGGHCYYCRKLTAFASWTVDHKIPLCRGGSNFGSNKVGACATCNHAKGPMTEEEFWTTPPNQRKAFHKSVLAALGNGTVLPPVSELDAALDGG